MIAGVIAAVLLPTLVFLPTLNQKMAGFIGIMVLAVGIAALAVKLKKKG